MSRNNVDNAPVGHTCNIISSVISIIEDAISDPENQGYYLKDVIPYMEEIRSHNSQLRDWGNEYYSLSKELEHEVEKLQGEIEGLEYEIKELT